MTYEQCKEIGTCNESCTIKRFNSRDLGRNSLGALNSATFKSLIYLIEIDLFDNRLDYLPDVVFNQLDSLEYL